MTIKHGWRLAPAVLLAATGVGYAGLATATEAQVRTEPQQLAAELLSGMADYVAALPGFRVSLVCSYDAMQASGQKIEFNELRQVTLARPDKLRIEQESSEGAEDLVVFDGKNISILDAKQLVYAQAPQPGSIDDAVVYFVRDLGIRLPLAQMLSTRLPAELDRNFKTIDYVEFTDILGVPAHHVAATSNTVDIQVWIADGERPLPLRIILTYKTEPGQPQFRAQFLDWDEKSPAASEVFRFEPPADARQIMFAVQGPPAPAAPAVPTAKMTGSQK